MKPAAAIAILSAIGLFLQSFDLSSRAEAPTFAQEWEETSLHLKNEKPESAAAVVKSIAARAEQAEAWLAWGKAVAAEAGLAAGPGGWEDSLKTVLALRERLAACPDAVRPLLRLLQAQAMSWHLAMKSSDILSRTGGIQPPENAPPAQWDMPRWTRETDAAWALTLRHSALFQMTKLQVWSSLLSPKRLPDDYQPTVYDFVMREAVESAVNAGQWSAAAEPLEFPADSPLIGNLEAFLAWNLPEETRTHWQGRTISMLQDWLKFHAKDRSPAARTMVEIRRLEWAAGQLSDQDAAPGIHEACLRRLLAKCGDHPVSLAVRLALVEMLSGKTRDRESEEILAAGLKAHRDSVFATRAEEIRLGLLLPSLGVEAARLWNAAGSQIRLKTQNLPEVWLRLVRLGDASDFPKLSKQMPDLEKEFSSLAPVRSWSVKIPGHADLKPATTDLQGPTDAPPGLYALLVSDSPGFEPNASMVHSAIVTLSTVGLFTRTISTRLEVWAVDSVTGAPLEGAKVSLYGKPQEADGDIQRIGRLTTDAQGRGVFSALPEESGEFTLAVKWKNQGRIASHRSRGVEPEDSNKDGARTWIFTDRPIYRPGQTVHFKIIAGTLAPAADGKPADFQVAAKEKVTTQFKDPNDQEIGRVELVTNSFGSCSGSFVVPASGATGQHRLQTGSGQSMGVDVEEYKRPRFTVEFQELAGTPKLGDPLRPKAVAKSLAGAGLEGAEFTWKARSEMTGKFHASPGASAGSGRGRVGPGGEISLELATAKPSGSFWDGGAVDYSVTLSVTDSSGETREAEAEFPLRVEPFQVTLAAPENAVAGQPSEIQAFARSCQGRPVSTRLRLRLSELRQPDSVVISAPPEENIRGRDPGLADWDNARQIAEKEVATDAEGRAVAAFSLPSGAYRAEWADGADKLKCRVNFIVIDPKDTLFPVAVPFHFRLSASSAQPGEKLTLTWGSGHENARAFIRVESLGGVVHESWTEAWRTQQSLSLDVLEAHRGGLLVSVWQMRDNRIHGGAHRIQVPWSAQKLKLTWEHFTSKLEPGAPEKWTVKITGPDAKAGACEFLAGLRDASLDEFSHESWPRELGPLPAIAQDFTLEVGDFSAERDCLSSRPIPDYLSPEPAPELRIMDIPGYQCGYAKMYGFASAVGKCPIPPPAEDFAIPRNAVDGLLARPKAAAPAPPPKPPSVRRKLQETAFFLPQLVSKADGTVEISFTAPESLTAWKFFGFAHDRQLRSGVLEGTAVTSRELMVQPNAPRFLREGDVVDFPVKITNTSSKVLSGAATLTFRDAASGASADAALGVEGGREFTLAAGASTTVFWKITAPSGLASVIYKAGATAGAFTDGEENSLAVLPRQVLVRDSLAMPLREAGEKSFTLAPLAASGALPGLRHQSLTLRVTTEPTWEAVLALPYLMEYPHECFEQTFSRYYANSLAESLAGRDPALRKLFDRWQAGDPTAPANLGPLEKFPELKSVSLNETPWVANAKSQREQRRDVGLLFDAKRLKAERTRLEARLLEQAAKTDGWPWFPGGPHSDVISLHIMAGLGRMVRLGLEVPSALQLAACQSTDRIMQRRLTDLGDLAKAAADNHFDPEAALWLRGRGQFPESADLVPPPERLLAFYKSQALRHWRGQPRLTQAHTALALLGLGEKGSAALIAASLKERAQKDATTGLWWRENPQFDWWASPLEAHCAALELFHALGDHQAVRDGQAWLLTQKQTQSWPSTKSTADAVNALFLGNPRLLDVSAKMDVTWAGNSVKPEPAERGIGQYAVSLPPAEITPERAKVTISKPKAGVAWASLHWQYFQDADQVKPSEETPLSLKKELFLISADGKAAPLPSPAQARVGDEILVRLTLETAQTLDYVHLKDQRPASTEPTTTLSTYEYQGGLGCYRSTRDSATHFFIETLPAGNHVVEHRYRVQLQAACPAGLAEAQCLYVPEFAARAVGGELRTAR